MPYLKPKHVLDRFSEFALEEIRPAIDDEFLQGQVGSMASTLQFLSIEIDKEPEALERQRGSLLNSLDNIEGEVQNPPVFETTRTTKEHITNCSSDGPGELEASLLEGCNNVLSVIDKELEGEAAARARQPLYEFLDTRVQSQLDMMRRRSE